MAIPPFRIRFVFRLIISAEINRKGDWNLGSSERNRGKKIRVACLKEIDDIFGGESNRGEATDQYLNMFETFESDVTEMFASNFAKQFRTDDFSAL